jgi:hypothetical protein
MFIPCGEISYRVITIYRYCDFIFLFNQLIFKLLSVWHADWFLYCAAAPW